MNGCWTIDGEYVGWGRNIFIPTDKTLYCFCDERDGCNHAFIKKYSFWSLIPALLVFQITKLLF